MLAIADSLNTAQTEALARLLCLLEAGEGAAARSFAALARESTVPAAEAALAAIAREEAAHGEWVVVMSLWLPKPTGVRPMIHAARDMHLVIGQGTVAQRLAGVAALDSAACILFSKLLHPRAPLAVCDGISNILRRIHRDEAKHVAVASHYALSSGALADLQTRAAKVRRHFAEVLELVASDFDDLGVDPDSLLRAIRVPPAGLFKR